jgi:protein tyrosine/serine phosphatase
VQTAPPPELERQLRFDGCFNFRDLGGYDTTDGRMIRWRRLFRADGPHALTAADHVVLGALGLATIIDLRTEREAADRGSYTTAVEARCFQLPMIDVLPDAEELPAWIDPAVVADRYRDMLDRGADTIAESFAILSDPASYPVMFHCSAGKDRTGILAALVLASLGVPDDQIVDDYCTSGPAMERLVAHFQASYPDAREQLQRVAPAMVSAEPAAMIGLLAGLRADYGSIEGYVAELGVETALPFIREALLAPPPH